MIEFSDQLS